MKYQEMMEKRLGRKLEPWEVPSEYQRSASQETPAKPTQASRVDLEARQQALLREARQQVKRMNDNFIGEERTRQVAAVRARLQTELDATAASFQEASKAAEARAQRKREVSDQARAQVQRMIDKGSDVTQLAQQFVSEGRRDFLDALREEINYTPEKSAADGRSKKDKLDALKAHDTRLMDETERRDTEEARQWGLAEAYFSHNHTTASEWLGRQEAHPMNYNHIGSLYRFDDAGLPAGILSLADDGDGNDNGGQQVHNTYSNYRYRS